MRVGKRVFYFTISCKRNTTRKVKQYFVSYRKYNVNATKTAGYFHVITMTDHFMARSTAIHLLIRYVTIFYHIGHGRPIAIWPFNTLLQ
ncbi:hypothetical protein ACTXT7_004555 [Hymenolepis weldensis]